MGYEAIGTLHAKGENCIVPYEQATEHYASKSNL